MWGKVLHAQPRPPAELMQDRMGFSATTADEYHSILSTAWQNCPDGWKDDGDFCRQDTYDRGRGYPWKFGNDGIGALCALHQ